MKTLESEKNVTKLLCERQILKKKALGVTNPDSHNLGTFLKNYKPEPNPYDERFVFIQ